jgi:hypothetical protein
MIAAQLSNGRQAALQRRRSGPMVRNLAAGWIATAAFALLAACARTPDAEAIRASIAAMAEAAEARRTGDVLAFVSDDFTGEDGALDRAGLERLLRARLLAGRAVGVRVGRVDVALAGERATARFELTLTDGSGRWLAEGRAVLDVTTGWRREGRTWRCHYAKWSDAH